MRRFLIFCVLSVGACSSRTPAHIVSYEVSSERKMLAASPIKSYPSVMPPVTGEVRPAPPPISTSITIVGKGTALNDKYILKNVRPSVSKTVPPVVSYFEASEPTVDELLAKLVWGKVVFNTPSTMLWKSRALIQLSLGVEIPVDDLAASITAEGERQTGTLRVSPRMSATLTGVGVQITPVSPMIQVVGRKEITQWTWEVVAVEPGTHPLHLTVNALLQVEGSSTEKTLVVFDRTLIVTVEWSQWVVQAIAKYWQWFIGTLIVPLVVWRWKQRKTS